VIIDIPPGWALVAAAVAAGIITILGSIVIWWLRQLEKRSDTQEARIAAQDARIQKLEARDRKSWIYIQSLILFAHTHAPGIRLPDPPDGWMEDD
jgi:hypothetical protein